MIGDRVLVNKLTYDRADMARGDIVVFHRPPAAVSQLDPNDDSDLIKRLMGLPGETLEGREDGVYVDSVRIERAVAARRDAGRPVRTGHAGRQ